ncbi:hypothetical protein BV898_13080 [Hypsibius exemplaris]|uniref:Apple domain-containing protein n=1 Tax=Hypsibius exemplaris TaxID=2072580 RepID=A0A1W0WBT5_HYPEX|nr:hypothetical protein BV898_13080 [Hypsibius exemplaris]
MMEIGSYVSTGSVLAVMMCLMGQCQGFERVHPQNYPQMPKQLSVRIEMILVEAQIVEEFRLLWDAELNLTRYDYALGREIPPFNSIRPMKTILDFGDGLSYTTDPFGAPADNCTIIPLEWDDSAADSAGSQPKNGTILNSLSPPHQRPLQYSLARIGSRWADQSIKMGNLTSADLLRALDPRQLFDLNAADRVYNSSSFHTDNTTIRGIPCDNFWIVDRDFFVPGYGKVEVRHDIFFMKKDFSRGSLNPGDYWIPVQQTTMINRRRLLILNFFDFTVPGEGQPALYDFTVPDCFKSELPDQLIVQPEATIQLRFPISPADFATYRKLHALIPSFRRETLKQIVAIQGYTPIRVTGMLFSMDPGSAYITAILLPTPPPALMFLRCERNVQVELTHDIDGSPSRPSASTDETFTDCARACREDSACQSFVFCVRTSRGASSMMCLHKWTALRAGAPNATRTDEFTCDLHKKIVGRFESTAKKGTSAIELAVQSGEFLVNLTANDNTTWTLTADKIREDVQIPIKPDPGSFNVPWTAVRGEFAKLSPDTCRQRCLEEKRFTCQSVAVCVHGDCVTSDLHRDELERKETVSGMPALQFHSHCIVYTRGWLQKFSRRNSARRTGVVIRGVLGPDGCAKECLFGGISCRSFAFCRSIPDKESACLLQTGVGELEQNLSVTTNQNVTSTYREECSQFDRNYGDEFEPLAGYSLLESEPSGNVTGGEMCAQKCLDTLGDSGCLSFELCNDPSSLTVPTTTSCRISSTFIPTARNANITAKVRPVSNCNTYARTLYVDGTPVTRPAIGGAFSKSPGTRTGFTISEMAGAGTAMFILGTVVALVLLVLARRSHFRMRTLLTP